MVTRRLEGAAQRAVSAVLHRPLGRVSLHSLLIKGVGMVLVFALSVVLARTLGPTEYGVYEYVIAWTMLLLVPAAFGLDKLAVRQLSAATARGDLGETRGFLRWSLATVLGASVAIAAVAAAVGSWTYGGEVTPALVAFWLGCLIVPLSALTLVWEASLRGLGHVLVGQLPILIVRPVSVIALVLAAFLVLDLPRTATSALGAFLVGAVLASLLALTLLLRRLPEGLRRAPARAFGGAWFAAALPMMVMTALYTANSRIGTILLGSMVGAEAAGIYALASRGADLVIFTLVAVNTALSPTFAGLYARADRERLQRVVTRSARLIFALSLPLAALLFVFAGTFLSIFGEGFVVGADALRVLLVGQVVNVSMGSVGVLLVMADRERLAMGGFALGTFANLVLALVLVPPFGVLGAAWAATASMVVWNVALWSMTLRTLGVNATVLGGRRSS